MARKSDTADSISRGCFLIFVAVFFSVWYAFLFVMNDTYQEGEQANHWPTVMGTILEAKVQSQNTSSDSGIQYVPMIRYQYLVQGRQYVNEGRGVRGRVLLPRRLRNGDRARVQGAGEEAAEGRWSRVPKAVGVCPGRTRQATVLGTHVRQALLARPVAYYRMAATNSVNCGATHG